MTFRAALLVMLMASPAGRAADAPPPGEADRVQVEAFRGPSARDLAKGQYPGGELMSEHEGWVRLNFMIDPQGKPYEIGVEDSLGGAPFERNAIRALEASTFNPATLNGQPVHSAGSLKYRFAIRDMAKEARREFYTQYRKFILAMEKGDREVAEAQLQKLVASNLYEDAYRNIARYHLSRRWGTEEEQVRHLENAIAGETTDRYLEKKVFAAAVRALMMLNVKRAYWAEALEQWETLQKVATPKELESLKTLMTEVKSYPGSGRPLKLRGNLGEDASWFHTLLRPTFQVVVLSGRVIEVKLRCEKNYFFFRFDPTLTYSVNRRDGQCRLELIGDPDTRFELTET